jgi:hypothetical protein
VRSLPETRRGSLRAEIEQYRIARLAELKSDSGALSLTTVTKEGENKFGSNPANEIVLPKKKRPGCLRSSC